MRCIVESMKERPINLDLGTIRFPITAIVSISHRLSGVMLLIASLVASLVLRFSAVSEQSFISIRTFDYSYAWLVKLVLWFFVSALSYHSFAGIRHILMDIGFAKSLEIARITSWVTIILSISISIFWAGYIWLL